MKDFFQILKRFIPPYKKQLILNFLFNLLSALFTVFSVALMIPILNIIFGISEDVVELAAWSMDMDTITNNMSYYITAFKIENGPGLTLLFVGLFVIIATMLKVGFYYMGAYQAVLIRNGVVKDIREQIYSKILRLALPFFSEERKGDIISRITGDVSEVENSIMSSLDMFLKNPIIILVLLISMLVMSPSMTLFILMVLPVAGFIIGRVGRSLKKISREGQDKMGEILTVVEETLGSLRIIKAFNAERKMNARFTSELYDYKSIMNRLMRRRELAHPLSELIGTVVIIIVVWYGGTLILSENSQLTGSVFIAYIAIFYQIINPAKAFTTALYSIQKGLASMNRIDKILLANITIPEATNAQSISTLKDSIEYRDVSFSYEEKIVLKKVSLKIPKGKTVALVGQSGSGKTTFVDLLPRFYDVKTGHILIDGIDLRHLKLQDLRDLMGNVNQEAILFNDTIFNNIAFGVDQSSMPEVIAAAKVANAHDFIIETEHGYDTVIGDRGSKLSGGQRQRLSIARAILKNPPILILDEATSALDTESERLVQDALENLMKNRTSVVIAHRLSTVRNADLICVFHEGQIVERGTHDELIELDGRYKKLHNMQMF